MLTRQNYLGFESGWHPWSRTSLLPSLAE